MKNERIGCHRIKKCALLLGALLVIVWPTSDLSAQAVSAEGLWKTISDRTGKATSIVKIWIENDKLFGKVDRLFRKPGQDPNPICTKCSGARKDQPIKGLTILWELTRDEDEWNGGYILDPDNGETYRCIVKVGENGDQLHVRGYIGFSLFGRTQVWHRVNETHGRSEEANTADAVRGER